MMRKEKIKYRSVYAKVRKRIILVLHVDHFVLFFYYSCIGAKAACLKE